MSTRLRFDPFRDLNLTSAPQRSWSAAARSVPMDAVRREDHVIVTFDLPGVEPDSIDLTAEHNSLTLRAERSVQRQETDEVLLSERPTGTWTRSLRIGQGLDTSRVEASYVDGVLTVVIPVAEEAKPRKVAVSSSSSNRPIDTSSNDADAVPGGANGAPNA